jgi:serine/threonine-protein kinase HipA
MSAFAVTDALYLWWLVKPDQPALVGTLRWLKRTARHPGGVSLTYCTSWLNSGLALSEDLPLRMGEFLPPQDNAAAGAVDDARPDRWGERVIRLLDHPSRLSTLEYLYFAGNDRFGALGVSTSAEVYRPREFGPLANLSDMETMLELVRKVEAGQSIDERLSRLISPGASLGGARPKALMTIDGEPWVVKFSEHGDVWDSPLIEHATMTLAKRAGISVCQTRAIEHARGHALVVKRFDRNADRRLHVLSAHVALRGAGLDYGYPELALLLRRKAPADQFQAQGEQLFRRMVFNILIDNTDDHEKNHALLVADTQHYTLAPAFDVLPTGQALGYQQLRVGKDGAVSTLANALSEHHSFAMTRTHARAVCSEVCLVVAQWQQHFAHCGVTAPDLAALQAHIDRPFLQLQRA